MNGLAITPMVFISYSRSDAQFASRLVNQLKSNGLDVWFAEEGVAEGSQDESHVVEIGKAHKDSDALLLLWSENASKSGYVKAEWSMAMAQHKKVIPYILDSAPLPGVLGATQVTRSVPEVIDALKASQPKVSDVAEVNVVEESTIDYQNQWSLFKNTQKYASLLSLRAKLFSASALLSFLWLALHLVVSGSVWYADASLKFFILLVAILAAVMGNVTFAVESRWRQEIKDLV